MALTERLALLISADVNGAVRGLGKVGDAADKNLGKAEKRIDKVGHGFQKAGAGMLAAGGIAAIGLYKAGQAASSLEQSAGAIQSVFGESAKTLEDFGETAAQTAGLSKRQVNEMGAVVGASLKGMGFEADEAASKTVELEKRAADMAATFGGTTEDAISSVASALRGERDPIERFGVSVKQADVNARILALGLDTSTVAAEKNATAVATLDLIMSATADTEGAFAREAGTAAGAQARLKAAMENLQASLGQGVAPVMAEVADTLGGLVEGFNKLPKPMQESVSKGLAFGAMGLIAAGGASFLIGKIIVMRQNFGLAQEALTKLIAKVGIARAAFLSLSGVAIGGAAIVGMEAWNKAVDDQKEGVRELFPEWNKAWAEQTQNLELARTGMTKIQGEIDATNDRIKGSDAPWDADYRRGLQEGRDELVRLRDVTAVNITKAEELAKAMGISEDAAYRMVVSNKAVSGAVDEVTGEFDAQEAATIAAKESLDKYREAIDRTYESLVGATNLSIDYEAAIDDLTEQVKSNSGTLDLNTEAGRRNAEAALAAGEAIIASAKKRVEETGDINDGAVAANLMVERLKDEMRQRGISEKAIEQYIRTMKLTPKHIATVFTVDTWSATQAVQIFRGELEKEYGLAGPKALAALQIDLAKAETGKGKAKGGPVFAGEAYLVGEKGPELFVPGSSGTIVPNATPMAAPSLGGMTVNVYMPPGSDGEDVVEAIRRYERRNGPGWRN